MTPIESSLTFGRGGLGHFAVLWASALGAEVYVLSHSPNKKEDAMKMGAKHSICTNDEGWHKDLAFTFDFILNCADATHKFNLKDYFSTMKVMGRFHNVSKIDTKRLRLPETCTMRVQLSSSC